MLLTKVISTVPRALLRPISKQRCRRRKGPRWSVRRALPQAIGSLIHPDLSCGAVALPEDLTPRRLSSPCWGTEGSNPACSSSESGRNFFARSRRLFCQSPEITSTWASPTQLLQARQIADRQAADAGVEGGKPFVQPIVEESKADRKLVAGRKHGALHSMPSVSSRTPAPSVSRRC